MSKYATWKKSLNDKEFKRINKRFMARPDNRTFGQWTEIINRV